MSAVEQQEKTEVGSEKKPSKLMALPPRCLVREAAAEYLGTSTDQIDRLVHAGHLAVVRLPVVRHRVTGRGSACVNRRVLLDVRDLDALIDRCKERHT